MNDAIGKDDIVEDTHESNIETNKNNDAVGKDDDRATLVARVNELAIPRSLISSRARTCMYENYRIVASWGLGK